MSEIDTETPPDQPQVSIVTDPDRLGGAPHIAETRVRVSDIVVDYHYHERAPEEIAADYPRITVTGVYAALSYFAEHTTEIRAEIQDREHALRAAQGD